MRLGYFAHLKVFDVRGVLLSRVVQFTALTQRLIVHRQRYRLHVHDLVVGDGGLERVSQLKPLKLDLDLKFSWCFFQYLFDPVNLSNA